MGLEIWTYVQIRFVYAYVSNLRLDVKALKYFSLIYLFYFLLF